LRNLPLTIKKAHPFLDRLFSIKKTWFI